MGIAKVPARVFSLTGDGDGFEADFLVDTGSIDCMAPAERLHEAEIRPVNKRLYELAGGEPVEYEYGFARVAFMGAETVAQVIFGPPTCEPILGVAALENVGVAVDPTTKSLKWVPAIPLK